MTRLFSLVLSLFLLFGFQQAISQPFKATVGSSDAYIDVKWDLVQACFEDASNNDEAYEEGVFLELRADGAVIWLNRSKRAAELLLEGKLNITEIAYSCGFSSATYLVRTFKQFYGMTPGQFRKNNTASTRFVRIFE